MAGGLFVFVPPAASTNRAGASTNRAGALSCRTCSVIPLTWPDLFASDIETCKHVSASLGSVVIPLTGLDCCGSAIRMSILILAALALRVIPATERESPARAGLVQGSLV